MSEAVLFKRYLHSNKEDNFDIVDHFEDECLKFVGYEVELVYSYNKDTRETKLIAVDGLYLSDEKFNDEVLKLEPK